MAFAIGTGAETRVAHLPIRSGLEPLEAAKGVRPRSRQVEHAHSGQPIPARPPVSLDGDVADVEQELVEMDAPAVLELFRFDALFDVLLAPGGDAHGADP